MSHLLELRASGILAKIDMSRGGALVWMSDGRNRNVLDRDDDGRCVQASVYFGKIAGYGGMWRGMDFPANAVQGGDFTSKATPPCVLKQRTVDSIATETQMVDWVTGKLLPVTLRQVVHVSGSVLNLDRTVIVSDEFQTPLTPQHQEFPAVFAVRPYYILRTGGRTTIDLQDLDAKGNQYGDIVNGWCGLTNSKTYGVYLTTNCTRYTGYRVDGLPQHSCAYVAPIATHTIRPGWTMATRNRFHVGTLTSAIKHLRLQP